MKAPYQDRWRDGRLVEKGRRDCGERYALIRPALEERLGRGFSIADVGGWDGYFATRLSEDCDAEAVNIDRHDHDVQVPHRVLNVDHETVGQVGRHDAILALSVLHHMDDWQQVYEQLKRQCRLLVVELAHPDEAEKAKVPGAARNTGPSFEHVMADDGLLLGWTVGPNRVSRPLLLVRNAVWGPVVDGTGRAAPLIEAADFSALGYTPFPGSLNVQVGREGRDWLARRPHIRVVSGRSDDRYVPVSAGGVDCYASFQRKPGVVELIAADRLRSRLGLDNGDEVAVWPR